MQQIRAKVKRYLPLMDANLAELVKGSSTAFIFRVANGLLVYLFNFLVAKLYGPSGNGLFSFCFTVLNILAIVGILGMETYIVRALADYAPKNLWGAIRATYFKGIVLVLATSAFLAMLGYFLLPELLAGIGKTDYQTGIKIIAAALIPTVLMKLHAQAFRGLKSITLFSIFQNGMVFLVGSLCLWVLHAFTPSLNNVVWAILGGETIMALLSILMWKTYMKPAQTVERPVSYKGLLSNAIPLMLVSTIFYLMTWTDKIMLGSMTSQDQLGIYEIATRLANLNTFIIFAINTIAAPKISELYGKNAKAELKLFTHQTTSIIILLTIPIIFVILVFPAFLLNIFGSEFIDGKFSLLVLAVGHFINSLVGPVLLMLNMTGHQKTSQFILLGVAILNFFLNFILIPQMGIDGAAIATSISTILWNLLAFLFVYKYFKFWTIGLPWKKA